MEIDSPSSEIGPTLSPRDRIIQRLTINGVPREYLEDLQPDLVRFVRNNKTLVPDVVSSILTDIDVEAVREARSVSKKALKDQYRESMLWLKWLMFEGDPNTALENLAQVSVQRGVCGAVWGKNDIAFRCRTCEHDPTCAICVPCFQNGDHKNHDYSIIYTGGGCCDCGDETAWKREGFCSKHKGAEQIQPLPDEISNSVGPVLDVLLTFWKDKLLAADVAARDGSTVNNHANELKKVASELTCAIVEVLLEFCKHSESLLSFISNRLLSTVGLLNLLVRAEKFFNADVTKKLHELLLKLLGEPTFKYEFAKVFIDYYAVPVAEVLRASSDSVLKRYPLLSMFGVQIFTVPTLTPRLVKEWNLLDTLLECLGEIFLFCCGEDGHLEFNKWAAVFDTCIRVMEDIRFVLSHSVVAKYVTHERMDIVKTWLQILSLVQGMNPQKRETGIHIEEENENAHLPFLMCNSIANIHLLLVKAAFSVAGSEEMDLEASFERDEKDTDDLFRQRHAKVGRVSEESSVCSSAVQKLGGGDDFVVQPSVSLLMFEALRAIDCWLAESSAVAPGTSDVQHSSFSAFKTALLKIQKGKEISRLHERHGSTDVSSQHSSNTDDIDYNPSIMEIDSSSEKDTLMLLSLSHWHDIDYDVSSQEVSVHLPLHGLLSLLLKEALRNYCGEYMVTDKGGFSSLNTSSSNYHDSNYHDFFGQILVGCHPYGFSSFMMEHPLQNRVFCSQVRAGMWRKNGDAAIVCFEWYRSIRWSDHELELDLFLLQICAALAPADAYVRRLLERFQMSSYLTLDLERSSEYEPVLMQELLTLIIQIIKERRFCGLTASENLQRELVCKLATGDATHSQLVKSLPRDLSKFDQLQEVLDKVAQYSNPSGINQGKYSLRMPYWKELDLYHPCWNPRDLQVAEERYSRFCGVSALSAQVPKWTNIYKPLIGVARIATCKTVLQIIRAVIFYSVVTDRSTESRAPDGVLITALHLLSLGLDICSVEKRSSQLFVHDEDSIPLLAFACEEVDVGMHHESGRETLLSLLALLMRMHRKESASSFSEAGNFNLSSLVENLLKKFAEIDSKCMSKLQQVAPEIVDHQANETVNLSSASDTEKRKLKAREKQAAILAKMKAEQSKFLATLKSSTDAGSDDFGLGKEEHVSDATQESEEKHICCLCHDPNSNSPVSFLILLQKSRLVNFVDRGPPSWDQGLQSDRSESTFSASEGTGGSSSTAKAVAIESFSSSELLLLVQGAINEFACQAHPTELNAFIEYLKLQFPGLRNHIITAKSGENRDKTAYSLQSFEQDMLLSILKEMNDVTHDSGSMRDGKVISCGEDASKSYCQDSLLLGKYIASLTKESKDSPQNGSSQRVEPAGRIPSYDGFGPSDCDGIHVSSCGHAVHQGCLDRYLSSLKERFTRRMIFEGGHIVDPDQGEFLCPVCRRLANSTLPAAPGDSLKLWEQPMQLAVSLQHSSGTVGSSAVSEDDSTSFRLKYALSMLQTAASFVSKGETLKSLPVQQNRRIRRNLEPVYKMLSEMYFPGKQDMFSRSGRLSPSVLLWDALKYSLVSTEIAARSGRSCLAARKGLDSLYSEFWSSGGFILPLMLRIIQSTRSKNLPDMLLRFRGIRLFAESICSGVTYDNGCKPASSKEGKLLCILKHTNSEMMFPDMQFWNQVSDPVLIRDPFSTLMWILFCFPYPFLSWRDSFLSLVHMLYAVSIAQAIIAYCVHSKRDVVDLGFHDCLVTDIAKWAQKSVAAKKYFISNHVDPSDHIEDVIKNLSLPYLRRCALLWKLLESCAASPCPSRVDYSGKSSDISDWPAASCSLGDIDEFCEVQNLFKIPPLDAILKDEVLRSVALKWFQHFSNEFEDRSIQRPLHLTPTVPFKLMHLPLVYQDLVQRYIKPRCPHCSSVQDEPALCLLCGRLCSPAWKPCCRESGCQAHAAVCGAGTGVFLLIRKTTILLQRNARQAPWPSPYLDTFGEEDIEMHRGKPLYLNEERYAALAYMVASHGLDRSSKVLRQTTIGALFII